MKSVAFVPLIAKPDMTRLPVLVLVTVIATGVLVVLTGWLPKATLPGLTVTPEPDEVPIPESPTLCGLPLALSVMLRVAERAPVAAGEKVTPRLTLSPGVTVIGSAGELRAKSVAFAPETARLVITKFPARLPVAELVTVTVDALLVPTVWLPKLTLDGVMVTEGAVPVPLSGTECGLPVALSAMLRVAERAPVANGVNTTFTVVVGPVATVMGVELALKEKSPALDPEMPMEEITRLLAPELPISTDWVALALFTF